MNIKLSQIATQDNGLVLENVAYVKPVFDPRLEYCFIEFRFAGSVELKGITLTSEGFYKYENGTYDKCIITAMPVGKI